MVDFVLSLGVFTSFIANVLSISFLVLALLVIFFWFVFFFRLSVLFFVAFGMEVINDGSPYYY